MPWWGCTTPRHFVNLDVTDGRLHILTCHNGLGCVLCKCSPSGRDEARRRLWAQEDERSPERAPLQFSPRDLKNGQTPSFVIFVCTRLQLSQGKSSRLWARLSGACRDTGDGGILSGPSARWGRLSVGALKEAAAEDVVCHGNLLPLAQKKQKLTPTAVRQLVWRVPLSHCLLWLTSTRNSSELVICQPDLPPLGQDPFQAER